MIAVRETGGYAPKKRKAKPYVIKVNEKSGVIYLERERHPLLVELPYMTALMVAIMFSLLSCFQYIHLKTDIELRIRETEALERQLHTLQTENTLAEREVADTRDFNFIYEVATKSLGMVPAAEANILFYDRSHSEYVYQRDNIPFTGLQ